MYLIHLPAKPAELGPIAAVPCPYSASSPKAQKTDFITHATFRCAQQCIELVVQDPEQQTAGYHQLCTLAGNVLTHPHSSEQRKEREEGGGWMAQETTVSPLLTPLISNEEQEELLLPQQPWSLFEAIWRQLKEKE